ncbi:MAG TPA: type II toxin-antitoxin system Phd/YefM family antitoxin [Chloroflexota bacterium]|nr:type II toxin-antitoxin system Phd/YefM family antitoxin [Chloroflexota bacterium]
MRTVGIRELKEHTSEIVRDVRERGESVDVTYRGRIVARLVPVQEPGQARQEWRAFWADWKRLASEISAGLPEATSAEDVIRDIRREP